MESWPRYLSTRFGFAVLVLFLLVVVFPASVSAQASECKSANDTSCLIAHFTKEIKANPRQASNYNGRGLQYLAIGNHKQAMKDFTRAIEVEPSFDRAYINRGEVLLREGNFDAAIKSFGRAIEIRPNSFYGYGYRADAYFDHGDYELAIRDYTRVNDLLGNDEDAYARCAWASLFLADGKGAITGVLNYLKVAETGNRELPYMLIVGHLGLRQIHEDDNADEFLSGVVQLLKPDAWSSQIMRYLLGEISDTQLFALATDSAKKLEANAYVGMNLSLTGDREAALDHLRLVVANSEKSLYVHSLAQSEIHRLEAVRTALNSN